MNPALRPHPADCGRLAAAGIQGFICASLPSAAGAPRRRPAAVFKCRVQVPERFRRGRFKACRTPLFLLRARATCGISACLRRRRIRALPAPFAAVNAARGILEGAGKPGSSFSNSRLKRPFAGGGCIGVRQNAAGNLRPPETFFAGARLAGNLAGRMGQCMPGRAPPSRLEKREDDNAGARHRRF